MKPAVPILFIVALLFGAPCLFSHVANASPFISLTVARECPARGENAACTLQSWLYPKSEYPDIDDVERKHPNPRITVVRARLNKGAAQTYRLKISWPQKPSERDEALLMSGYPPSLAYLGQSATNHPIVLTTDGELEILSRGWFTGSTEEYLVDDRSWKVIGHLINSDSGPTVVSSATDLGIWDESRKLCVSAVINPRRRLSLLHDGCALHRAPPSPRDIAERRRKFAENIKTVAWQTPGKFVRWLDAWNRAVRTGLSTQFIYDINSPYVPLAQQLEINPNLFSNTTPAPIALGRVRRLLPHAANSEMGDDATVSDFFGGAGAGISISRIGKSHTLIITVDYDDC